MKEYAKLKQDLESRGVDLNCVRINQTPIDSTFCILNYGDAVEVFFFERGIKFDLESFKTSREAIEYFKRLVLAVPTVFKTFTGKIE